MHDRIKKITKKKKKNVVHTLGLSVIYSIGYRTVLPLCRADGEVCVFVGGGGGRGWGGGGGW